MITARSLWNGNWVIHDLAAPGVQSFVPALADIASVPPAARPLVLALIETAAGTSSVHITVPDDEGADADLWVQVGVDGTAEVTITGATGTPPPPPALPFDLGLSEAQLLDLSQQGVWVVDPEGRSAYVNPRMATMLGYDVDELSSRSLLSIVDERDRRRLIAQFDGSGDPRNSVGSELRDMRLRGAGGTTIWSTLSINRITNGRGTTSAVVAIVTDNTVQHHREDVLAGSERRMRATFEHGPEAQALLDADGRLIEVNEAFRTLTGRDRSGLVGAQLETLVRLADAQPLRDLLDVVRDGGTGPRGLPVHLSGTERATGVTLTGVAGDPPWYLLTISPLETPLPAPRLVAVEAPPEPAPAVEPAERVVPPPPTTRPAPIAPVAVRPAPEPEPEPALPIEVVAERKAVPAPAPRPQPEPEPVPAGRSGQAAAYQAAFTHAPVGMAIIDLRGEVREANPAMHALLDPAGTARQPMRLVDLVGEDEIEELQAQLAALRTGESGRMRLEVPLHRDEAGAVWTLLSAAVVRDPDGRPAYAIAQAEDITERRVAEHDLVHQTLHDPLTGLGNRLLLRDQLQQALAIANDVPFAVMFLDLDRFKSVNDTYGHDAGDALLIGVAQRLRRIVRAADTVARLGGDEFAIIAQGIADRDQARILADKVRAGLRAPFRVGDIDIEATASIGMVLGNREYATGDQLLRDADIAMYRAKDGGRDRHELFDDEIRLQEIERLETERTLHAALDGDGLKLHYQPIIDLHTGRAIGAEALLRIADTDHSLLRPDSFIGVAEDSRLILDVGAWVLREVCAQLARWSDAGFGHLVAWVNVSGLELASPRFPALVQRALSAQRIDPARLHIECTENVLLEATPSTVEHLRTLADLGVAVGIDDFGTGYSSLGYLRDLPVSFLKIDAAFTRRLDEPGGASMVEAMVSLGRSLGLRIVAEGVESRTQMESLAVIGCDLAQGHLFARPGPIDAMVLTGDPEIDISWP